MESKSPTNVSANILPPQPDPRTPPIIQLPNGVPLITPNALQEPNRRSYNQFMRFDVDTRGIIINNALKPTSTQLGGEVLVPANPHLQASHATYIIIQAIGSRPTQLQGPLEVAGSEGPTVLVIANPQGITCQAGCNFVNVTQVVLAAGCASVTPKKRLSVKADHQGSIVINPSPLGDQITWTNLYRVDLAARFIRLNAKLKAKQLTIRARWSSRPRFPSRAIDITRLGGIYAKNLQINSKEAGASISSTGDIKAENLDIGSNGDLTLFGTIRTNRATLTARGKLTQAAQIDSRGEVRLTSQNQLVHAYTTQADKLVFKASKLKISGRIQAVDSLSICSSSLELDGGRLTAGGLIEAIASDRLKATGNWHVGFPDDPTKAPGMLRLYTDGLLESHGIHRASGNIEIRGSELQLNESTLHAGGQIELKATQHEIYLNETRAQGRDVIIEVDGTLHHRNSHLAAGSRLRLKTLTFDNTDGKIYHRGTSDLTLASSNFQGQFEESSSTIITDSFDNQNGVVYTTNDFILQASSSEPNDTQRQTAMSSNLTPESSLQLNNTEGQLQAGRDLVLSLPMVNSEGLLQAGQKIILNLCHDHHHIRPQAFNAPSLFLNTPGFVNNKSTLNSSQTLQINSSGFRNEAQALVNGHQIQLNVSDVIENEGRIYGGKIELSANAIHNKATILETPPNGPLSTTEQTGIIAAHQNLHIITKELYNFPGSLISSEGDIHVGGHLDPDGDVHEQAQKICNSSATIEAQGHLIIRSHELSNDNAFFVTEMRRMGEESRSEYQPEGEAGRYPKHQTHWGFDAKDFCSVYLCTKNNRKVRFFTEYNYQRVHEETVVNYSYPSLLQSGQDMQLSGEVINDKSEISVGGTLSGIPGIPYNHHNKGASGERIYRDTGHSRGTYLRWLNEWHRTWGKHKRRHYHPDAPYNHERRETIDLPCIPSHGVPPRSLADTLHGDLVAVVPGPVEPGALQLHSLSQSNWVPTTSLFRFRADPQQHYLIESDCHFPEMPTLSIPLHLSSNHPVRLGNSNYEQRLIRNQIRILTHQRYLPGYSNDQAMFRGLMEAGYSQSLTLGLQMGSSLSSDQIRQLNESIIWMVTREVTLRNGRRQSVLVPRVYLAPGTRQHRPKGALVSAGRIEIKGQSFRNEGSSIISQEGTQIEANIINNQRGNIGSRNDLKLKAELLLDSTAGRLKGNQVVLEAEAIRLNSKTQTCESANGYQTVLDGTAQLQADSLQIKAKQIEFKAAQLNVRDKAHVEAREQITLSTVEISRGDRLNGPYYRLNHQIKGDISTQISANGGISLIAKDIDITGGQLATEGDITVEAENNIKFRTAQYQDKFKSDAHRIDNGLFSTDVEEAHRRSESEANIGTSLTGRKVEASAGDTLEGTALQIKGEDTVALRAGGLLQLEAAANSSNTLTSESHKRSGLIADSDSITLGKQSQKSVHDQRRVLHTGSQIHSGGNLTITAGKKLSVADGSLTAERDVKLQGRSVEILSVDDQEDSTQTQQEVKSGLSVRVSGGLKAISDKVEQNIHAIEKGNNFGEIARNGYEIGRAITSTQAHPYQGVAMTDVVKSLVTLRPTKALKASGLEAEVSLGKQSQSQSLHQKETHARSSHLQAGGNLTVEASDGNITLIGGTLGGENVDLSASKDIKIVNAEDRKQTEHSTKKAAAKIGMGVSAKGTRGMIEAQQGRQAQSKDSTQAQNVKIQATQTLKLRSGDDTELTGVEASAEHTSAKIGGSLQLRSAQDTVHEQSHNEYESIGISVPIGSGGTGSLSCGQKTSKIKSQSANVKSLTGLQAGDGGFDIEVGKSTQLEGAQIHSEASVDKNRFSTETLEHKTIENTAYYESQDEGFSFNTSTGLGQQAAGNLLSGIEFSGNPGENRSGITSSGLSAGVVDIRANSQQDLPPTEATHQIIDHIDTAEITKKAELSRRTNQVSMQLCGDIADSLAKTKLSKTSVEAIRVGLHASAAATSAALSGGSAKGAVAGTIAGDLAGFSVDRLLKTTNMSKLGQSTSNFAINVVSGLTGAAAGATVAGKAGAFSGATSALDADRWNRQLHRKETESLAEYQKKKSPEEKQRLFEAAAYLTRASLGVPESDPNRANLQQMEARGEAHAEELRLLRETNLFQYTKYDKFSDFLLRNDEKIQRTLGVIQALGGAVGIAKNPRLERIRPLADDILKGTERAFASYQSREGKRVLDSYGLDAFPGDRNWPLELAKEVGKVAGSWTSKKTR
ncbi:hypothetical protein TWF281_004153 [Arthrobotrys megalospora]